MPLLTLPHSVQIPPPYLSTLSMLFFPSKPEKTNSCCLNILGCVVFNENMTYLPRAVFE